ncbi:hypothetical protein RB195_001353 [Necator americanus]|uniref:Uncharacterized protein n=1 Tax=Necator americanus TaxID=51031 RepID=A0ABR1DDX0_NECAM
MRPSGRGRRTNTGIARRRRKNDRDDAGKWCCRRQKEGIIRWGRNEDSPGTKSTSHGREQLCRPHERCQPEKSKTKKVSIKEG